MVKLDEKWGRVLKVEHEVNGVNSLTFARIIIKTKTQERIEERVRIDWDSGSGTVLVRESCWCRCMKGNRSHRDDNMEDGEEVENRETQGEEDDDYVSSRGHKENTENESDEHENSNEARENTETMEMDAQVQLIDNGSVPKKTDVDLSVDEWLVGPMSCPVEQCGDNWFDPIVSVECPLSLVDAENMAMIDRRGVGLNSMVVNTPQSKRPRGRPKRVASSLPDSLSVPSTPLSCSLEASATWKTAKMLGISAHEESAVIEELRR